MSAFIYLEGGATGANSKYLDISCERAFHKLLDRMGFTRRKPRLVACGGRGDVFDRFRTALRTRDNNYIARWIDSEDPMTNTESAWDHLAAVTTVVAWERPNGVTDDQVLFMTTCMETWIVADRETLKAHYGGKLLENRLPSLVGLEGKNRHLVQDALARATESCPSPYKKGEKSFAIFAKLDPAALNKLPSFDRTRKILEKKLPRR